MTVRLVAARDHRPELEALFDEIEELNEVEFDKTRTLSYVRSGQGNRFAVVRTEDDVTVGYLTGTYAGSTLPDAPTASTIARLGFLYIKIDSRDHVTAESAVREFAKRGASDRAASHLTLQLDPTEPTGRRHAFFAGMGFKFTDGLNAFIAVDQLR